MKFNDVELTAESVASAHRWFADNARACIAEMERGEVMVTDPAAYRAWREESAKLHDACAADPELSKEHISFALLQRAHTIQTGECIALLP